MLIAIIVCVVILILGIVLIAQSGNSKDPQNGSQGTENQETIDPTESTTQNQGSDGTNDTQTNANVIGSFPYAIPGSDLVIEQINSYDGIFFEDGTDREVSNVSAIVLANKGEKALEYDYSGSGS